MDKKINPAKHRDLRIISGFIFIVLTFIFLLLGYRVFFVSDRIAAAFWEAAMDRAEKDGITSISAAIPFRFRSGAGGICKITLWLCEMER